jgi:hypothetical protein
MAIKHTWSIVETEWENTAEKPIVVLHWRLSSTETVDSVDYTGSSYGTVSLEYDVTAESYIPWESVTEKNCLDWAWQQIDKTEIQNSTKQQVENQKIPPTLTGTPWSA